jgi:hypothetical protein
MEIRLLLEKYKNLGFSQKRIKEITLSSCEKFSLKLGGDDVEIKQTEIKINISGTRRAHFVLVKQKLEQHLQEEFKKEGLLVTKIY